MKENSSVDVWIGDAPKLPTFKVKHVKHIGLQNAKMRPVVSAGYSQGPF